MIEWLVLPAERADLLKTALPKAWRGGAGVAATLTVPPKDRALTFAWPEGATAKRRPNWPDLLKDWNDINDEEKLFPSDHLPVAAEEVSGLGVDALIIHLEPGLARASVAWYVKGALWIYEHVGASSVAWSPSGGLGRPLDGTISQALARGGRALAGATGGDVGTYDRIAGQNAATGEEIATRAIARLCAYTPLQMHVLAGQITAAPARRLPL